MPVSDGFLTSVPAESFTMLLAGAWFVVFWILGGVLFAAVATMHFLKLKKTRFSCLFSLASAAAAYGAAVTGIVVGKENIQDCLIVTSNYSFFRNIAPAFLGCGAKEIFLSGAAWFVLLMLASLLLMLLSRRETKPLTPS